MRFERNQQLMIEGITYSIVGIITFKSLSDHATWKEYRLLPANNGREAWLSIDNQYEEYSISFVTGFEPDRSRFHLTDEGDAIVLDAEGAVDVDRNERLHFMEYEDTTEEQIISFEYWSDGVEYSTGHYLDQNEIVLLNSGAKVQNFTKRGNAYNSALPFIVSIILFVSVFLISMLTRIVQNNQLSNTNIDEQLEMSSQFIYISSITGTGADHARVYLFESNDYDACTKSILSMINGQTIDISQDDSEGEVSITIITKNEYCLIYQVTSEDALYVQVSSRRYMYETDSEPYHCNNRGIYRHYRQHYFEKVYKRDKRSYGSNSSYQNFQTVNDYSGNDSSGGYYNNYAKSVHSEYIRQSSNYTRQSSGGGLSSGK